MCSANILATQLLHALGLAFTVVGLGLVALVLDRYASKLMDLGASESTVSELRRAATWLLRLDLLLVLAVGAVHLVQGCRCLLGL